MLGKVRSSSSFEDYHHRARSDISRLLDPSYTTYSQQKTYGAYVDAQGNMHDPDYRQFPLIQQASQYSATRRTLNANVTRPHWELVDEDALLLDDEEDLFLQQEDSFYTKRNSFGTKSTVSTPRHYPSSRRSHSPSGGMRLYPRSTAGFSGAILTHSEVSPPTSWSSSSSSSESSSPSSTCSSVLKSRSQEASCRIASSLKRKRRRSTATSGSDKESKKAKRGSQDFDDDECLYNPRNQEETVFEEEEPRHEEEDEEEEESWRQKPDTDTVPTCGESLKKQWQAWSLRIRFGMFRAERRIKRRVQSLI